MINKPIRNKVRKKRHLRVRNKIKGTAEKPRLNVFRSSKNIYAQIINDINGTTLVTASSLDKEIADAVSYTGNKEAARLKNGERFIKTKRCF